MANSQDMAQDRFRLLFFSQPGGSREPSSGFGLELKAAEASRRALFRLPQSNGGRGMARGNHQYLLEDTSRGGFFALLEQRPPEADMHLHAGGVGREDLAIGRLGLGVNESWASG